MCIRDRYNVYKTERSSIRAQIIKLACNTIAVQSLLWFTLPMNESSLVKMVNGRHNLSHEFLCFTFIKLGLFVDVIHQFSPWKGNKMMS